MKIKKIGFKNKKREVNLLVNECNMLERIRGLMFRKNNADLILLFNFKKQVEWRIHSYFVFFDFLAVWTDDKNNIIERKIVKPFTLSIKPKKSFYKLIEIPINKKNKKIIHFFVGKRNI
jgi:uncharacterized membrane protein (UPF0127 family)|tara:strand:- start:1114 stop:1470 length:357 start_codon:yes stop_codon:yes gene_type:complete